MKWLLLIFSLPNDNAAARMRCWRAIKALGAGVLRDGVVVLPATEAQEAPLRAVAQDLQHHDGTAYLLNTEASETLFAPLFDRSAEYGQLLQEIALARQGLDASKPMDGVKQARKLRKAWGQLADIDYFPGEAQKQVLHALEVLEQLAQNALSPNEPQTTQRTIAALHPQDYQGRTWATRERPWVDRLACAWLIRRFIDPQARFLWLPSPAECPPHALGFDFDGATFTHVGARVSFETLLASFQLETPALLRLGVLVHALDAGGVQPPESAGVERVLAGMRDSIPNDDQLVFSASAVFDGLWSAFQAEAAPSNKEPRP